MTEGVLPGGSQPVSNAASVMSVLTCVKKKKKKKTYLRALLHLLHHPLVLLGDGQCGRVDPLVDHLPLPRLEREQTLSCVTHPAPGTHTQRQREVRTLWSCSLLDLLIYKICMLECALIERRIDATAHWSQTHTCVRDDTVRKQRHTFTEAPVTSMPEGLCGKCWYPGMFLDIQSCFVKVFMTLPKVVFFFFFLPKPANISVKRTRQHRHSSPMRTHTHTFPTQKWTRWSLVHIGAASWEATWRVWGERCGCPTGRCFRGWSAWCTPRRCPGWGWASGTRWNVLEILTISSFKKGTNAQTTLLNRIKLATQKVVHVSRCQLPKFSLCCSQN